jgi:lysophospholipase L1-like esterase
VRRFALPLLAGVLLVAMTACQDDEPPVDDGIYHYVALGDSYTAAPGVPTTDPADPCFRSDHNYPNLLVEKLPHTVLTDVSCSGANTDYIIGSKNDQDAQLDAVEEDTDLVTIGVGGNDSGVFLTWLSQCSALAVNDPEGSPCADANATSGGDALLDKVADLEGRLRSVIEDVQDEAPNAAVIMVTYPQILPAQGSCPDKVPFAAGDYAYINSIIAAQNDAIVAAAKDTGVEWVNVEKASLGHDICSKDPWINGFTDDSSEGTLLHPFPEEQAAVALLILDKIDVSQL